MMRREQLRRRRAFAGGGARAWRWRWLQRSRRVCSPCGVAAIARRGCGWPSAGRAWCGKTSRRAAASARDGAPPGPARAPGQSGGRRSPRAPSTRCRGRSKTAIGTVRKMSCHRFQYGSWARLSPPISQTKSDARKAPAQCLQRVGGVGRAEPSLDAADPDAPVGGGDTGSRFQALGEGRHAGGRLQRVLRRYQPPHLVEIEAAAAPAG